MGKEKFIPIIALMILLIGTGSSAYVYATQTDTETLGDSIIINNQQYTVEEIFSTTEQRTFESLDFTGIALDDLITKIGVDCPSCHSYAIIGEGDYQKTVTWENMKNGLLTADKMTVFSDLPKAFRVRGVFKIEVISLVTHIQ